MENKVYEFTDSTVDGAIEAGLGELGLSRDDVEVKVKSYGGIFSKACIVITVKEKETEKEKTNCRAEHAAEHVETRDNEDRPKPTDEQLDAAYEALTSFMGGLVEKLGVRCEIKIIKKEDEILVAISGADAGALIGYRGEVLDAVQYMALCVANKCGKEFVRVTVDAENYRQKRKETLTNLAHRLAEKCSRTCRRVELEPMNPFERRVIHTALVDNKSVKTESEGEGRFRHVVIIPTEGGNMNYGESDFRKKGPQRGRSFGKKY